MSASSKPPYNDRSGTLALAGKPPFSFQGVTLRVFPLEASMSRLETFCDAYLNMDIPREIAYFRPSVPFVFMLMVDYGKMASEAANVGWVSQNELLFCIWLDWFQEVEGKLVLKDIVSVSPFIFVDNEMSQITGREVYGWPKTQFWMGEDVPTWARDPEKRLRLMSLRTLVSPKAGSGQRPRMRTVLDIEIDHGSGLFRFPPDLRSESSPFIRIPRGLLAYASAFGSVLDVMTGLPSRGFAPGQQMGRMMLPRLMKQLQNGVGLGSAPFFNTVNLKQFRDAALSDRICFQALVSAKMKMTRFNRGGTLGDYNLLLGDPSAGYTIRIGKYSSLPVVETFGLDHVAEEEDSPDEGHDTGAFQLKPVFPFWVDVDIEYGIGQEVCWRTRDPRLESLAGASSWQVGCPAPVAANEAWTLAMLEAHAWDEVRRSAIPYNTARGAAEVTVTGPFRFGNTIVKVLPLMADEECLRRFCTRYFLQDEQKSELFRIHPFGSYVYLIVEKAGTVSSGTQEAGQWAGTSVRIVIPVKVKVRLADDEPEKLITLGLLSPFVFMTDQVGTITTREVNGWPTELAQIECPANTWLEGESGQLASSLLRMRIDTLAALGAGERMEKRLLLEIVNGPITGRDINYWRNVADTWGTQLKKDHDKKKDSTSTAHGQQLLTDLKALGLELLANNASFNELSLKQFRDSENPDLACFQAIVSFDHQIEKLWDLREIDSPLHVHVHHYPSHPIVSLLGLAVKATEVGPTGTYHVLESIRPFQFRADTAVMGGHNLVWRSHDRTWMPDPEFLSLASSGRFYFQDPSPGSRADLSGAGGPRETRGKPIRVGRALVDYLEAGSELEAEDPVLVDKRRTELKQAGRPEFWPAAVPEESRSAEQARPPLSRRRHADLWTHQWLHAVEAAEKKNPERQEHEEGTLLSRLTLKQAREAVEGLEPQFAIESILSKEWFNFGNTRWYRRNRLGHADVYQKPDFCVRRDSVGEAEDECFPVAKDRKRYECCEADDAGWWTREMSAERE